MTDKQMTEMTASADHFDNDAYSGTRMRDRALNAAIIRADISNSYEAWTLDLVAASGATCTLSWYAFRRWNRSQVVFEHHYDFVQRGGPLTLNFRFTAVDPEGFRLPS